MSTKGRPLHLRGAQHGRDTHEHPEVVADALPPTKIRGAFTMTEPVVDEVHLRTLIEMPGPPDMPAGVLVSGGRHAGMRRGISS